MNDSLLIILLIEICKSQAENTKILGHNNYFFKVISFPKFYTFLYIFYNKSLVDFDLILKVFYSSQRANSNTCILFFQIDDSCLKLLSDITLFS